MDLPAGEANKERPAPSVGADDPPFTSTERYEVAFLMACALDVAHRIIEDAIEGRPLSANRLENYYGTWMELLRKSGCEGDLIGEDVTQTIMDRWGAPAKAKAKP